MISSFLNFHKRVKPAYSLRIDSFLLSIQITIKALVFIIEFGSHSVLLNYVTTLKYDPMVLSILGLDTSALCVTINQYNFHLADTT